MTLSIDPQTGTVSANFDRMEKACLSMLSAVRKEQIGYAKLGAALALARLENSTIPLTVAAESAFVSACMEWVDAYFSVPIKEGALAN